MNIAVAISETLIKVIWRLVEMSRMGCTYVDGLKAAGSDYLTNCGYAFSSDDKVVAPLLEIAAQHGGQRNVVWNAVLKVANA